jgi:cytochrome oxidase assembly protein ShyY1
MGCAMYRFLLRPRWIAGHLLLIVTVVAFVNLGFWQLRRLDERRATNERVSERLATAPAPLDAALSSGADAAALDFRPVEVTGTFVGDVQLLTAPRSFEGRPGQQVLAVLEPAGADGPALLIDRGYVPFDRATTAPPVPDGQVRLTGVLRAPEAGEAGDAEQVARIVPTELAERLGRPLDDVYLQVRRQQPTPAPGAPRPTPLPELTEGSHLSYAVQWFSFAAIALIGYPVLVWRTARQPGGAGDTTPQRPRRRADTHASLR